MRPASAIALVLVLLAASRETLSFQLPGAGIVQSDVTTSTGSRGVMYRPVGDGPYPAVLHLHGSGDTVANNEEILQRFARAGYVAVAVEYRSSQPGVIDRQDIYASLEYLSGSRHVKRGVVGLNGFSLGARMALLVAGQRKVLAVSAIAARTSAGSNPTILDSAPRLTVPILLQHGTEDSVVPYDESVLLERKLKSLGRPVEFFSYPGAGHNSLPWGQVYDRVLTFFAAHLR